MGGKQVKFMPWNDQVLNYLDSIAKNREHIVTRCGQVKDLVQENIGQWPDPKWAHIDIIMRQYWSARLLFSIGLFYLSLDCCRKMIEQLVRFQQDILPDAHVRNFPERISIEVPWSKEDRKVAGEIYEIGSAAVHVRRDKIWEKSKRHSLVDDASMSRVMEEKMPEDLKRHIPALKRTIHGTFGMQEFTLETLNRTVELTNRIIENNRHVV